MAVEHAPIPISRPKPYIFQPPSTPASAAISSPYTNGQSTTRKRSRNDPDGYFNTPFSNISAQTQTPYTNGATAGANSWMTIPTAGLRRDLDAPSPAPLVNERYRIRGGGVETPSLGIGRYDDDHETERNFRRRWSVGGSTYGANEMQLSSGSLAVDHDMGRSRSYQDDMSGGAVKPVGWGKLVFNVAAGVAGALFDFARASTKPFRGFVAGGGAAYSNGQEVQLGSESIWQEAERSMSFAQASATPAPVPGQWRNWSYVEPMPGQWRADSFQEMPGQWKNHHQEQVYHDHLAPEPEEEEERERPAMKRAKTDDGGGWVVVMAEKESHRPESRMSIVTDPGIIRSPTGSRRQSRLPRASIHTPVQRPLSRRSMIPVSRRSPNVSINLAGSPNIRRPGSPALRPGSPAFSSGGRSPGGHKRSQSELSPAAASYVKRMEKEERQQDAAFDQMSRQLQMMIKEGRQALGTRVVIEDE